MKTTNAIKYLSGRQSADNLADVASAVVLAIDEADRKSVGMLGIDLQAMRDAQALLIQAQVILSRCAARSDVDEEEEIDADA